MKTMLGCRCARASAAVAGFTPTAAAPSAAPVVRRNSRRLTDIVSLLYLWRKGERAGYLVARRADDEGVGAAAALAVDEGQRARQGRTGEPGGLHGQRRADALAGQRLERDHVEHLARQLPRRRRERRDGHAMVGPGEQQRAAAR